MSNGALTCDFIADNWHVDSLLAVGGMGVVYAVTHRRGRRGALKVTQQLGVEAELRFVREVTLTDVASYVGSPSLLGYGVTNTGAHYLVVELLRGETLLQHSDRRGSRFDLTTALLIIDRVAASVEQLHALGVVHRDLQPGNVFITEHGEIKVLDFGLAVRAGSVLDDDRHARGAPGFMPPEHAHGRGDPLDPRGDVFSLGALLYWMIGGTEGPVAHLGNGTVNTLSLEEIAHVPFNVIDLVNTALEQDPRKRFGSVASLRRELAALRDEHNRLELTDEDQPNA